VTAAPTAYELSRFAELAAKDGDIDRAKELMAEAAALDGGYGVRASLIGTPSKPAARVSRTIAKRVIGPLLEAGCFVQPEGKWSQASILSRVVGPRHLDLHVATAMRGAALHVTAARWTRPGEVEYFPFAEVGLPGARISYASQAELEAACAMWVDVLLARVLPWGTGLGDSAVEQGVQADEVP
jgi:hypothetical protein